MPYNSTRDLKEDVLFRGSESVSSGTWTPIVINLLNRAYHTMAAGSSEYLPEYVEDWWWLRRSGVLNLEPVFEGGEVTMTFGETAITFDETLQTNLQNYRLFLDGYPESFLIRTHSAGNDWGTLDSAFTGASGSYKYKAMRFRYTLPFEVSALISPMSIQTQQGLIRGTTPERMDFLYPTGRLTSGVPEAFALDSERDVRFSHGGLAGDQARRIRTEYRYRPVLEDLVDSHDSIPLVPKPYRHLLADMALVHLFIAKNDDRAGALAGAARSGLMAMVRENRRRLAKVSNEMGTIHPRTNTGPRRPMLRTESGLVIG